MLSNIKLASLQNALLKIFSNDFLETFAPIAELSSLCLFSTLATNFNCEVFQFTVSTAYLNADVEEDVFVE